ESRGQDRVRLRLAQAGRRGQHEQVEEIDVAKRVEPRLRAVAAGDLRGAGGDAVRAGASTADAHGAAEPCGGPERELAALDLGEAADELRAGGAVASSVGEDDR